MPTVKKKNEKDPMETVLANIEKSMGNKGGKSAFARFGTIERATVAVIPFGIAAVDEASYAGGLERGKMVEIYGEPSSGKSLLTLFAMGEAQKQGLNCALIDVEQSFDPKWAAQHGVDVENLIYANTFDGAGEEALEYAYRLCSSGAFGMVVVDSTAALTPLAEIQGSLSDNARVGAHAQMMSRGCRKICDACGKTGTICVFINQTRMKIGVMYGNPETTTGGKALPFYAHIRMRVRSKGKIKARENGEDIIVGQLSEVTYVKNKTARPFGKAEFKVVYDPKALNPVVMLANLLKDSGMITTYKKMFRIHKDVSSALFDDKKAIETGATTMMELADWLITDEKVIPLLEYLVQEIEVDPVLKSDVGTIDGAILGLLEDNSKIVSPTGSATLEASKVADASEEDLDDMDKDVVIDDSEEAEVDE